jgi:hypothetical protein
MVSHRSRLLSEVRMNAPLRVPTRSLTLLILNSFRYLKYANFLIVAQAPTEGVGKDFGGACFQAVDGGVLSVDVIADFGGGHGTPHFVAGQGNRIECVSANGVAHETE